MPEMHDSLPNGLAGAGAFWCRLMHDAPMWPIHEAYRCRTCGRIHPIPWARQWSASQARLTNEEIVSPKAA